MKISGTGYEEFSRACEQGYFRHAKSIFPNRIVVQIGESQYRFKNNRVARINPETGKKIGSVRRLENVLKGKE